MGTNRISRSDDHDDTAVDAPAMSSVSDPPTGRRLTPTAAESDPATAIVRRDNCIELPPGSVVGEIYEIDAKLGAGAMGEVYAARHMKLGKRVAIKVIGQRLSEDAAAIERFAQEARALARIQHPAIVAVDHVGELADGRAYFVMEFLRGEALHARLERGRIPLPEALRIIDQMARGLEAAHAHGVTHRDLKPENVFLVHLPGEDPIVKIVDYGLAKLRVPDHRVERTQSGVALGTPLYMSPEQMRGPDVDHRTDVYALGCVAYEMLLGTVPFPHARTVPELYAAHLHESPPLPRSIWPEIPPQLDLVLFALLAKDPTHRPTLAQARSVFMAVRTGTPSQRAATEFVAPRPKKIQIVVITAIVAATLLGGILIGVTLTSKPNSAAPQVPATATAPLADAAVLDHTVAPAAAAPTPAIGSAPKRGAPQPPRNTSVSPKRSVVRPAPTKASDAAIVANPVTPGEAVDITPKPVADDTPVAPAVVPEKMPPRPKKPIDRNQTMNPFPKHDKVSP